MKEEFSLTRLSVEFENKEGENKHLLYKKSSRVALSIVLIFLFIQFGLILTNNFSKDLQRKMSKWNAINNMRSDEQQLFGVQKKAEERPRLIVKTTLSGEWQKGFEAWFNTQMIPFRSKLIKLHNQILYTVFFKSYMYSSQIVIGKKRYLYEMGYIDKYHNLRNLYYSKETFNHWVDDLQEISDFFKGRGQQFIYMVTPSKASYQPEYLPICDRCDLSNTRPDYHGFTSTLKKRGFKFVDTSESILNSKKEFKEFMFPKGGIHWTSLGGAFATRELMKEISLRHPLPPFQFTYRLNQKPTRGIDMDLAQLLNLLSKPKHYLVPEVFFKEHQRKSKKPIKIAIISGSFMFEVANMLARTKLFDQIDFYFYWTVEHYRNTPRTTANADSIIGKFMPFDTLGIHPNNPKMYDDIFSADVVILEENESNLRSEHFKALKKKVIEFQKKDRI